MKFTKILMLSFLITIALYCGGSTYAIDFEYILGPEFQSGPAFRLNKNETIYIKRIDGSDIAISNASGVDFFVPNKTQYEFEQFIANMPEGVSFCDRQDGGWSHEYVYCKCDPSAIRVWTRRCDNPAPLCGGSCDGFLYYRSVSSFCPGPC